MPINRLPEQKKDIKKQKLDFFQNVSFMALFIYHVANSK